MKLLPLWKRSCKVKFMNRLTYFISVLLVLPLGMSNAWALPNCPHKGSAYWTNCQGTYTNANGNKYVGEWKDDKWHGQGIRNLADGDKYVGEFKNGKKHGQGVYTYVNGNKYVGKFENDKRHGQGILTYANGDKYVGEFKKRKANGQGTFTFVNGKKWVGEWENNKLNGYALQYNKDGSIYQEGIFKNDKFLYTQKKTD